MIRHERYSRSADVYSFAMILFELLTHQVYLATYHLPRTAYSSLPTHSLTHQVYLATYHLPRTAYASLPTHSLTLQTYLATYHLPRTASSSLPTHSLTLQVPFADRDPLQAAAAAALQHARPLRALELAPLPARLRALLCACWEESPEI